MGAIVVGVDGSTSSREALRWAARQAEITGATLDVVMTWEPLNREAWVPHDASQRDPLALTRRSVHALVEEELGPHPPVEVRARAAEGPPAKVLLHEAQEADLLVLGNRGLGGFAGLLLGSVGLQCATHAPCPVVVVHARRAPAP